MVHESVGFARAQEMSGLFHDYCEEITQHATSLQQYFSDVSQQAPQTWCEDDTEALGSWSALESNIPLLPFPEDLDDLACQQTLEFYKAWHNFHTALPYSEAERVWFLKAYADRGEQSRIDIPEVMGRYEERIVDAGVRQLVWGRELAGRWLSWHLQIGEYADEGTLDIAKANVGRIATLFTVG